jgi:hypothetical protein
MHETWLNCNNLTKWGSSEDHSINLGQGVCGSYFSMLMGTKIKWTPKLLTSGSPNKSFNNMFRNCTELEYIMAIDTLNKASTDNMFDNTPKLRRPGSCERVDIKNGFAWSTNSSQYNLWYPLYDHPQIERVSGETCYPIHIHKDDPLYSWIMRASTGGSGSFIVYNDIAPADPTVNKLLMGGTFLVAGNPYNDTYPIAYIGNSANYFAVRIFENNIEFVVKQDGVFDIIYSTPGAVGDNILLEMKPKNATSIYYRCFVNGHMLHYATRNNPSINYRPGAYLRGTSGGMANRPRVDNVTYSTT